MIDGSPESQARALVPWVAWVLFVPWVIASCQSDKGGNDASTEDPQCTTTETADDRIYVSIWGTSETNVYAAGGGLWHFDGTEWVEIDTGEPDLSPDGVWGSSDSDIFIVGGGLESEIRHYDGASWSAMEHPSGYECITAIWGAASNDVFAIAGNEGSGVAILHYDGTAWAEMQTDLGLPDRLWGTSGTDVYAVGTDHHVYHYDGESWVDVVLPDDMQDYYIHDAWGTDPDNIYFVGGTGLEGDPSNPVILKKTGTTWTATEIEIPYDELNQDPPTEWLEGIWGYGSDSIFVTGSTNGYYWDGAEWNEYSNWFGNDIWGVSPQKTFITSHHILQINCQ